MVVLFTQRGEIIFRIFEILGSMLKITKIESKILQYLVFPNHVDKCLRYMAPTPPRESFVKLFLHFERILSKNRTFCQNSLANFGTTVLGDIGNSPKLKKQLDKTLFKQLR